MTAAPRIDADVLRRIDLWWRAANYLSVGQIYLRDNPLLAQPLVREHVKARLLGHWGTTPGLNFVYAHLNRLIRDHDVDMIWIVGPGHGGPAAVANTWLEGSYSERYPDVGRDGEGMRKLFRQFSWPYGIPSHVAAEIQIVGVPVGAEASSPDQEIRWDAAANFSGPRSPQLTPWEHLAQVLLCTNEFLFVP